MKTVKELWKLYEEEIRKDNPSELKKLNGPVSSSDLKKLETILPQGARLPTDYMDLIRIHNGSDGGEPFEFQGYNFLSMDGILKAYGYMKERADAYDKQYDTNSANGPKPKGVHGVQPLFNNPAWIPVLAASDWKNFICIDFDPASGGSKGQIIDVHHRGGPVGKVFKSFNDFFDELMQDLLEDYPYDEAQKKKFQEQAEAYRASKAATVKQEPAKPQKTSVWSRIFAREEISQEAIDLTLSFKAPAYTKW